MFQALLALCLFGTVLAQIPGWGPCPDIEPMPNFEFSKFMGKWYEAQRSFVAFEFSAKCVTAECSPGENDTVRLAGSAISAFTGKQSTMEAEIHVLDFGEFTKLKVKIPPGSVTGNYWILGTDYDSYAVIYSCTNFELANFKYVWVMTREPNPSKDILHEAHKIMQKHKLQRKWLMTTDQKDCEVETVEEIDIQTSEQVEE